MRLYGMRLNKVGLRLAVVLMIATGCVAQAVKVPEWETAAGGKAAFEVASVKLSGSKPGTFRSPSFPLSDDDSMRPSGGMFHADFPVWVLIQFAYKLNRDQGEKMRDSLPKWAVNESYTVEARLENPNATKDQQRLMVRALLMERFGMVAHFEMKEAPMLAMVLVKPGVIGPKLVPHEKGPACDAVAAISAEKVPSFFPIECEVNSLRPTGGHMVMMGARNTTMDLVAGSLNGPGRLGRPVVDRTGLEGRYDFTVEWTMDELGGVGPDPPDTPVVLFVEALRDQLGVKLEPTRAMVKVLVVDRVERPSEN